MHGVTRKLRESRYAYQLHVASSGLVRGQVYMYGDTVQPLLTCTVSEMTNITKFNIVYLYDYMYVYQLTALAQICRSFC